MQSLITLKGIGSWSASIFLLFNLNHPDTFPQGDASLEKALLSLYGVKVDRRRGGGEDIILRWSPYRSVAAHYLWNWIDQGQPQIL